MSSSQTDDDSRCVKKVHLKNMLPTLYEVAYFQLMGLYNYLRPQISKWK